VFFVFLLPCSLNFLFHSYLWSCFIQAVSILIRLTCMHPF
jgi:hypothetical protein